MTIAAYVVWLLPRPRPIGRNNWQITLPDAAPDVRADRHRHPRFRRRIAGVLHADAGDARRRTSPWWRSCSSRRRCSGFISHAPGSLGIFDATTLIALPQFQMEELLASLLIFRVLYFIAPFAVAVLMLGLRELWLARRVRLCPAVREQDAPTA